MQIRIKPVFILSENEGVFYHQDGKREAVTDAQHLSLRIIQLSKELRENLKFGTTLLEDSIVRSESNLADLKIDMLKADALLLYFIGEIPLRTVLQTGLPVIAFSGRNTPALAVHNLGSDRHDYPWITIAQDFQEIDEEINILNARKMLQNTRIALLGFLHSPRLHQLPNLGLARTKLGVEFSLMEIGELARVLPQVDLKEAETLADIWQTDAKKIIEPSKTDIINAAQVYLAMKMVLEEERANALTIDCIKLIYALQGPPPCYALVRLRDEGIHAGCDVDVVALLAMLLLGYLAEAPAFMGNIVTTMPEHDIVRFSHCVVPTKMSGYDESPRPYTLRNYHGIRHGVTAHVELDLGQQVTIAGLSHHLDRILLISGEIVECCETVQCRTTISVRVKDVRELLESALGCHHAMVYHNYVTQAKKLCRKLDIETIEL